MNKSLDELLDARDLQAYQRGVADERQRCAETCVTEVLVWPFVRDGGWDEHSKAIAKSIRETLARAISFGSIRVGDLRECWKRKGVVDERKRVAEIVEKLKDLPKVSSSYDEGWEDALTHLWEAVEAVSPADVEKEEL